jgi:hypothetical protein
MGSALRTVHGINLPLSGLRTEQEIVQVGDRLLSGLDPASRSWADQQARMLSMKPRFGVSERSLLTAQIAMSFPKLDPVAKDRLQLAVVYLALRASARGGLAAVVTRPAARTLFQNDILAG